MQSAESEARDKQCMMRDVTQFITACSHQQQQQLTLLHGQQSACIRHRHTHTDVDCRGAWGTHLSNILPKYNQKEIFRHQEFKLDFTITFVQFDVLRYTEMNHLQKMFGSEAQVIPAVHTLINLRGKQWGKEGKLVTPLHMHTVQRWVAGRSACTAHLC